MSGGGRISQNEPRTDAEAYQDLDIAPQTTEDHEAQTSKPSPAPASPASRTSSTNTGDIEYVYLNFDTEIATRPVFPDNTVKDYPSCPNLRKYDDPYTWSKTRKNLMTWVSCATNMTAAYSAGAYAAPEAQLTELWGVSRVAYNVGITVFTAGFGIGPMFLAPFSEINGRRPVFIATGILFVAMQLACSLTNSYTGMLVARFFGGLGGSTFSTMVGGILADIWVSSERNTPMVLFTGATLFGTGLGPLVSGFVAQRLLWRWVFYIQVITSGMFVGLITIFFKETRGPILLSRRARALNNWYDKLESLGAIGMEPPKPTFTSTSAPSLHNEKLQVPLPHPQRIRYKVLAEEQRASILQMIKLSLTRPAQLLFTEPVVICFSLWISFSWAILYLQFGAIPLVYETTHAFTLEQTGAIFTAPCVGAILSTILFIHQDKWAVRRFGARFTTNPEGRLWFTCAEALLMPIGMFWFGWTCYSSIHWVVPTIALVVVTMGIFSIFLATFNYTADVYQTYASSALAASGVCRNFLGGSFPLVTVQMFRGMGFQAASSLLGGVGIVLSLGPILLIWFGPKIRLKSKVARHFVRSDEV